MDAKTLYTKILSKVKGGYTINDAIMEARKYGLKDSYGAINHYTGMSYDQSQEFMKDPIKSKNVKVTIGGKTIVGQGAWSMNRKD